MAVYSRREVTTVTVEYSIPSPVDMGEVDKALAAVRAELGEEARWADAAWFEARDDEIVIRFEKREAAS